MITGPEVWGDESGNLDFSDNGSRYFIVCTITHEDRELAPLLLDLRRDLALAGHELHDGFHCSEDRQSIRDEVFRLLASRRIRADFTLYEKKKALPRISADADYFYKLAWFYHHRYVLPKVVQADMKPFIAIASLGTKARRRLYHEAVKDVVRQSLRPAEIDCAYWTASSHPCLQAADYYTWAVARRFEGGDPRSYDLIKHQVKTLCHLWG